MMTVMRRYLFVLLAACGSKSAAMKDVSNTPGMTSSSGDLEMDAEEIVGKPRDPNDISRQQAIDQAREAGIIGGAPSDVATTTLDKSSIRAAIRTRIASFQVCYEAELMERPGLAGTTQAEFTIGPDGAVVSARAKGFDPKIDECIAKAIKQVTFPKPSSERLNVQYPFTFKPAS